MALDMHFNVLTLISSVHGGERASSQSYIRSPSKERRRRHVVLVLDQHLPGLRAGTRAMGMIQRAGDSLLPISDHDRKCMTYETKITSIKMAMGRKEVEGILMETADSCNATSN